MALGLLVMAGGAALGEEYSLRGADNVGGKFTARVSIQELSSDGSWFVTGSDIWKGAAPRSSSVAVGGKSTLGDGSSKEPSTLPQ